MSKNIYLKKTKIMKNLLMLLVLAITVCTSCKKDAVYLQDGCFPTGTKNIVGVWAWESTSGGFAGTTETPASTRKKVVLTLMTGNQYAITMDDKIILQGTYQLSNKKNINNMDKIFINFNVQNTDDEHMPNFIKNIITYDKKFIEKVDENVLVLKDNAYDMYSSTFKR